MLRCLFALVLWAACAFGQSTPEPTRIGQHHIGETLDEWYAARHESKPTATCTVKNGKKWEKVPCEADPNRTLRTSENKRDYTWSFARGKLWHVEIMADVAALHRPGGGYDPLNFAEEIVFLTETYGTPSKVAKVPYHNGYGAQWEASIVFWNRPDGTLITASEGYEFDQQGTLLAVDFSSKDRQTEQSQQNKPNPYQ
jgi:hypothetical protein